MPAGYEFLPHPEGVTADGLFQRPEQLQFAGQIECRAAQFSQLVGRRIDFQALPSSE